MEIVLKRIAKKNSYTIGRLYILKDEEVERVVHSSWMNPQLKRWFEHKIDAGKLTQERYFCDTLEPTWRNLKGVELFNLNSPDQLDEARAFVATHVAAQPEQK